MKRSIWLLVIVVLLVAGWFLLSDNREDGQARAPVETPATPEPSPSAPPQAPAKVSPEAPERQAPPAVPLPPLDESDPEVLGSASEVFGAQAVAEYLVPDDIVRKVVVTIDNLPREKVSMRVRAVRAVPGRFQADGEDEDISLGVANFARYRPVVGIVNTADPTELAGHFLRFYPLFQEAYEELGYPGMSFLDRVIEAIDDLLAAPEVNPGVRLVRPKVMYEFADPALEGRSAGQKMLIRMGGDNAAVVKNKLRQVRAELVRRTQ